MATIEASDTAHCLTAKCRLPNRSVAELEVLDVSLAGCMVRRRAWTIKPDQRVLIKLPGLEYQTATVLWSDEENAGIEFENLLYEPVLMRFREMLGKRPKTS